MQFNIHRNNRQYRLLLNIAQMIFDSLLPDPTGSRFEFVELPEERKADIFEGFVRNYLARNLNGYTVKERRFSWSDTSATDEALAMLPSMRADVVVDTASTRRVIEVKFYEESLRTGHHGSAKKLISGHLYQLFAYLQNLKVNEDREISGVLLYAMAGDEFDLEYLVHGMPVRATSLDLTQSPEEIGARVTQLATSRFNIP
jgi:5-methylcytosine-specific restriction enzyme subunit McrC